MSEKIDNWLIGIHQSVVNWSQKLPKWWVEKCAVLIMLSSVVKFAMIPTPTPMNYVVLFIFVLLSIILIFVSHKMSAEEMKYFAPPRYFRIILVYVSIIMLIGEFIFGKADVLRYLVEIVCQVSFISSYYFVLCDAPPPKETKKELSYT